MVVFLEAGRGGEKGIECNEHVQQSVRPPVARESRHASPRFQEQPLLPTAWTTANLPNFYTSDVRL